MSRGKIQWIFVRANSKDVLKNSFQDLMLMNDENMIKKYAAMRKVIPTIIPIQENVSGVIEKEETELRVRYKRINNGLMAIR